MHASFVIGSASRIYIGSIREILPEVLPESRVAAISDAAIDRLHHELLASYASVLIGKGESIKTLQTVAAIYRKFLETGIDRSTFVLGIGGGIVTDITGFAASTYMRGLRFGFIPTTLLGQVDAAIGGKNGVNIDGYKNIAGTFNQPQFVICDPELLATLPEREFRAGPYVRPRHREMFHAHESRRSGGGRHPNDSRRCGQSGIAGNGRWRTHHSTVDKVRVRARIAGRSETLTERERQRQEKQRRHAAHRPADPHRRLRGTDLDADRFRSAAAGPMRKRKDTLTAIRSHTTGSQTKIERGYPHFHADTLSLCKTDATAHQYCSFSFGKSELFTSAM